MSNWLGKIKYPKIITLLLTIVLSIVVFSERAYLPFHDQLVSSGYAGAFFSGLFFCYGFTAAPATAILLIIADDINILLASLIAGLGALAGDLLIFKFIRSSFRDEIEKLSSEKIFVFVGLKTPGVFKKYLFPLVAGLIIASPLPDEIGVSLLAFSGSISIPVFIFLSYALNLSGIYLILFAGSKLFV